jgi:predicted PurR-regulated permease PerM/uncharacterized tellurite resistance protein B-like protein
VADKTDKSLLTKFGQVMAEQLRQTMTFFADENDGDAALTLICAMLKAGNRQGEAAAEDIRRILADCCTAQQIDFCLNQLGSKDDIDVTAALKTLAGLSEESKDKLLQTLVELSCCDGETTERERSLLAQAATVFGVSCEQLLLEIETAEAAQRKRNSLLRSGAGILAALAVLAVFVLTATVVVSVFFGLILAYICLPLEKFYERLFQHNGFCRKLFATFEVIISFGRSMIRFKDVSATTEKEKAELMTAANRARAVTATISSVVIAVLIVIIAFSHFSASYVSSSVMKELRRKQENSKVVVTAENKSANDKTVLTVKRKSSAKGKAVLTIETEKKTDIKANTEAEKKVEKDNTLPKAAVAEESPAKDTVGEKRSYGKIDEFIDWMEVKLENWKPGILENKYVKLAVKKTEKILKDPEAQKAVGEFLLKRSGGVFSFTAGFVSIMISFLFNLLMTIFFFSLILSHMAKFSGNSKDTGEDATNYVVAAILKSPWLPNISDSAIKEASLILGEIIRKLKVWLRGYLSIIAIEEVYFVTVFMLLKIPYGLPLGAIAGATLLLPLIGPVCSVALTLLVCLASGCSMTTIVLVLVAYIVMYGVVEQLILYPKIVGSALGLTRLETIIVVLMGGYLVGISGMIFAIPTAAVLKYLIPKLYIYRPDTVV